MKKFLFTIALAACGMAFAAGEYTARGIERKAFYLDNGTNAVSSGIQLAAGKTVAPYTLQVLSATHGSMQSYQTGVVTNFTVVDRHDDPTYLYIYTNGTDKVTNTFKKVNSLVVGTMKPQGYTLLSVSTNHTYTFTTNTVGRLANQFNHYSVTTNTQSKTAYRYNGTADSGKINLFGVENIRGNITTNWYLENASISGGKLATTNCFQEAKPLFAGDRLFLSATTADKVLVKIVFLTYGGKE